MNRQVNAISGRLSLRLPQRRSLEILERVTEIVRLKKDMDVPQALAAIRSEFPTVSARSIFLISRRSIPRCAAGRHRGSSGCLNTSARAISNTLANLKDLVLIMDESHRYRASAGVRAINELKPILGLELTAIPYVESKGTQVEFKNIAYYYRLANAMADGFVKEPAVVTRKDFNPSGMSPDEIERLKLEDGVRLHEIVKVELETYARENNKPIIKPFLLVIARDTTHASQLLGLIQSEGFSKDATKTRSSRAVW